MTVLASMKAARIWLLWQSVQNRDDPTKKPIKVPYYVGGGRREGTLDAPEDRAKLVNYDEALAAYQRVGIAYAGLAIALGPDGTGGHWQGIDLDDMVVTGVKDIADLWTRGPCAGLGYVEMSPSGNGIHLIGYGRPFQTLSANKSGIEAYAGGRFFTFTGKPIVSDSRYEPYDLSDYVEQALAPRHSANRAVSSATSSVETVSIDPKTVTELRSALLHMRSDEYDTWYRMGLALKELGETGRGLWMEWSATSDKFSPKEASQKWDGFAPRDTGYQAVFAHAHKLGWLNPASAAAHFAPSIPAEPSSITLEFAMSTDTATIALEYLVDPYLPARCVSGFYGRGATAKSSFVGTIAASISSVASTLWVSVEEPADWIKARHIKCGGADKTLLIVKAVASKTDVQGRIIASSFNVYEHLEASIAGAAEKFRQEQKPPLRLVVLDTAVGLTGWAKNESPNDDAAVKKLLGYLQALAERHNLSIAIIGHANKSKHEHFADTVMGASAWTNSPRLSFVHGADRREDYAYVIRVAKTNLVTFGAQYTTEPVHTLYERDDGPDSVLVRVVPGPIVWGDLASLEMFEDATKKPKDDDEGGWGEDGPAHAPKLPETVIQTVVEMLLAMQPDEHLTREEVEARLGKTVDRGRWKKADAFLNVHPAVMVERGEKNRVLYRRRPGVVL